MRSPSRSWRTAALTAAAAILLAGCGGASAPAAAPASSSAAPVTAPPSAKPAAAASSAAAAAKPSTGQLTTIRYGAISTDPGSPGVLPIDYAKKTGLDKQMGVDIQLTRFLEGNRLYDAFRGGAIDAMAGGTDSAGSLFATGVPLVALRPINRLTGFGFVVKADAPYKDLADLKGKKIAGQTLSGTSYFSTFMAFKSRGIDIKKDVDYVSLPVQAAIAAMEKGDIQGSQFALPFTTSLPKTGKFRLLADYGDIYQKAYNRPFFHLTHTFRKEFFDKNKDAAWALVHIYDQALSAPLDQLFAAGEPTFDKFDYKVSKEDHQLSLEASRPNVVKAKTTPELVQQVQAMYNDFHDIGAMDKEVKATDFWQLEP